MRSTGSSERGPEFHGFSGTVLTDVGVHPSDKWALTMSRVATPYLNLEEVWPLYRIGNLFRILLTSAERLG